MALYVVSGFMRTGTSMMMQILNAGTIPITFDTTSRPADESNPKGYYELEGGKIINKLMDGTFPIEDYKGRFLKITAFGLRHLPPGKYKISSSLSFILTYKVSCVIKSIRPPFFILALSKSIS